MSNINKNQEDFFWKENSQLSNEEIDKQFEKKTAEALKIKKASMEK